MGDKGMASFDIFCEPHMGCIKVAVDQANALIPERYDWRGTSASYSLKPDSIVLTGDSHFQLNQMLRELCFLLRKELVSLTFIATKRPTVLNGSLTARLKIERGITKEWARYIIDVIESLKLPCKCLHLNQEIVVRTDHIDDAQQIIAQLRLKRIPLPIHFRNLTDR